MNQYAGQAFPLTKEKTIKCLTANEANSFPLHFNSAAMIQVRNSLIIQREELNGAMKHVLKALCKEKC